MVRSVHTEERITPPVVLRRMLIPECGQHSNLLVDLSVCVHCFDTAVGGHYYVANILIDGDLLLQGEDGYLVRFMSLHSDKPVDNNGLRKLEWYLGINELIPQAWNKFAE